MNSQNFFESIPVQLDEELVQVIAQGEKVTLERIVSKGHTSPKSGWYDQEHDEWVMVLKGEALLAFEHGQAMRLKPGDYITIPAHQKHRVQWTDPDRETLWLAVHYPRACPAA